MWGSLSCPEMARQCLIEGDGMAIVTLDAEPFSRTLERRALANPERPYDGQLDVVRAAVLSTLSLRELPIGLRLLLLATLAERTRAFYHRDATALEATRLEAELARPRTAEAQAEARESFHALAVPAGVAANLVKGVQALGEDRELGPLVAKVFATVPDAGSLWETSRERRALWERRFADRLDLAFEAHAKSYWLKDWYVTSPDLLAHLHAYLCQVVIVRLLLFAHPDLLAAPRSTDLGLPVLERVLVEVVSRVTRALEHNPALVREIQVAFAAGATPDFEHAALLAIA